jgi:epoxyqueuosine reductase
MQYLPRGAAQRAAPFQMRPGTLSIVSVRLPCRPDAEEADAVLEDGTRAYIARYALGRDYHRTMRGRLLRLGRRLEQAIGSFGYRVYADSAPILEKALGRDAGLGWIGKNTLLLRREAGSWFLLGELFTDLPLPPDPEQPHENLCGGCQACLRACPTGAIVAPYTLDARRCISYLTIEHHGSIPEDLRPLMGNRIFGCDDCQLACPWNRGTVVTADADFAPRHGLDAAGLLDLWAWDEAEWLAKTEGMPLRRLSYERWLRNLAIAMGNAPRSAAVAEALQRRAEHEDAVVREHVAWALERQRAC